MLGRFPTAVQDQQARMHGGVACISKSMQEVCKTHLDGLRGHEHDLVFGIQQSQVRLNLLHGTGRFSCQTTEDIITQAPSFGRTSSVRSFSLPFIWWGPLPCDTLDMVTPTHPYTGSYTGSFSREGQEFKTRMLWYNRTFCDCHLFSYKWQLIA
jgi:hypothetical protein